MEKELEYKTPELTVVRYNTTDVITTSGDGADIVDPPWGGEVVPPIWL